MKLYKMSGPVCLAAVSALLQAGSGAAAEVADSPAPEDAGLQEVIVTAQHKGENIQDVPISINAFSAEQIKKLGIQSSADLGFTPNVTVALSQGAGNQPTIVIRGIGINDENTNNAGPIAIYVDDVYLSSPAAQTFAAFDLDRIEVLKGPQGTLYGRNTSGGAISFVSAKPTDDFTGNAHVSYSSYNTVNLEGALGGQLTPGVDARLAVVKNYSQGYTTNYLTGGHENGANDYAVRGQLLFKPTDDLKVLLNLNGGQIDTRPAEYGHLGTFVPGTQSSATPTVCSVAAVYANQCVDIFGYTEPSYHDGAYNKQLKLHVDSLNASIRADYDAGYLTLTSISAIEHNEKFEPEDSDASPYRELEINWGVRNTTETQEFRINHIENRYNFTAGLYYLHEDLKQNQPLELLLDFDKFGGLGIPPGPGAGDGIANEQTDQSHQDTTAYAAFGQAEYNILDDLKLILGARVTHEHRTFEYQGTVAYQEGGMDNFGPPQSLLPPGTVIPELSNTNFSWRTGLNYNWTPQVMSYASVTTGFKSGDFNGGFLSTDPAQAAVQLNPIRPETDTSYEVGTKSTFLDRRLLANIAFFYTDYRNLQTFALIPSPSGPLNSLTSAKRAHNVGADIELVAKPLSALTLSAQVGLLNAKVDEFDNLVPGAPSIAGLQLAYSPHVSALFVADYKVPVGPGDVDLQLSASYKEQQFYDSFNDPYNAQPAYWLANARASYGSGPWEVAVWVKNLFDKQYSQYSFDATVPFGFEEPILGPPRFIGVDFNYHF
jgi:iron complex outermembrane receptor protein